jgi:hypothetical protein
MKFVDILGEAELSDDYRKVSRKVKLMYKTLRTGGFKVDKLIPNMVPFWTGFEMIDDGDALITYELPATYHLTSGNASSSYKIIITGITINCEKYPALADDIDVREDLLRRLARKLNNALKVTFNEGEYIELSIRKKDNLPSYGFENMLDESVVDSEDKYLVNKIKLAFRVLKNGNASFDHPFYNSQTKTLQHRNVDFKYELPNHIRIHKNSGDTTHPFTIQVPEFKIESERYSSLHNKSEIRERILRIIADKLNKIVGTSIGVEERINIVFEKPHHNKNLTTPITIRESVVTDSQEQKRIINKTKLVYKSFRKGKVKVRVPPIFNNGETVVVTANYELPTKFKIRLDFENSWNRPIQIFVPIEDIKIEYDFKAKNDAVQNELMQSFRHKIKMRFVDYDSNCDLHFISPSNSIKNTEDHIVKEERLWDKSTEDYSQIVKKIPTLYKAFKKGKVTLDLASWDLGRVIEPKKVTINYNLSDLYKVETDPFENNYNVKILIPTIILDCLEEPDLKSSQSAKLKVLEVVRKKFNQFGVTIFLRPTQFHLKHNGTWVNL